MKASLLSRTLHFIWIALLYLVATGCMADQTLWRYAPDGYPVARNSLTQKRVVVLPFKDSRPDNYTDAGALCLIPLMPYGWIDSSFPEATIAKRIQYPNITNQQFKPKEDFAIGATEELRASGLFKEVIFARYPSGEDVVLHGEVTSTRYYGTILSYGLSIFAGFPWVFGFPVGTVTNELAIEFHLDDRVTGTVLWRKKYHDSYKTTHWMYKIPRHFNYDTMYKPMLRDVVESLRAELTRSTSRKLDE